MFNKSHRNKIRDLECEIKWIKNNVASLARNVNCLKGNHSWRGGIDGKGHQYLYCEFCHCSPEKPKAKG